MTSLSSLPAILTSNSAYSTAMACMRRRWWAYEAENNTPILDGEATRGWERQRLSLPLSTGSWCHRVEQGLLIIASGLNLKPLWAELMAEAQDDRPDLSIGHLEAFMAPSSTNWIGYCAACYQKEARRRGLDLGLTMDGQLPEEKFVERTIAEQSALLEAFGWAYQRVRVPRILEEY